MTNRLKIKEKLFAEGFTLGCYDRNLEKLSKKELDVVMEHMTYGDTDIDVVIDRKRHIVEVFHVDNEVDFKVTTPKTYTQTYGRIFHTKREGQQ